MPSNYIKLRKDACVSYLDKLGENDYDECVAIAGHFSDGADWSRKQTLEEVKPLIEALRKLTRTLDSVGTGYIETSMDCLGLEDNYHEALKALEHFNTMKGGEGE
jgi:hypothetical protein